jgi:hypothetical protein
MPNLHVQILPTKQTFQLGVLSRLRVLAFNLQSLTEKETGFGAGEHLIYSLVFGHRAYPNLDYCIFFTWYWVPPYRKDTPFVCGEA